MKKIVFFFIVITSLFCTVSAQEIIKGLSNTVSLIPKSQRVPSIKNKDGSTLVLSYSTETGIKVMLGKNGKNKLICDPFTTALMVQVGEKDIDGDNKPELLIGSRSSLQAIDVILYKKADFEAEYKYWTTVHGIASVEFPGDGSVKLFDTEANVSNFKFSPSGDLIAVQ